MPSGFLPLLLEWSVEIILSVFLALNSQHSAPSNAVLDDPLITVDTTSLDRHKLYYCTIVHSLCEISDDVMVLISSFLRNN